MNKTKILLSAWVISLLCLSYVVYQYLQPQGEYDSNPNDPGFTITNAGFRLHEPNSSYILSGDPGTNQFFITLVKDHFLRSVPVNYSEHQVSELFPLTNSEVKVDGQIGNSSTIKCFFGNCHELLNLSSIERVSDRPPEWGSYHSRHQFSLSVPGWLFASKESCTRRPEPSCTITWSSLPPTPQSFSIKISPAKSISLATSDTSLSDQVTLNRLKWSKIVVPGSKPQVIYWTVANGRRYEFNIIPSKNYLISSNLDRIIASFEINK